MPRIPYFRGDIANAATTAVAPAPDFLQSQGANLAASIGQAFVNPKDDEMKARAGYYNAETGAANAKTVSTLETNRQSMRSAAARASMGDISSPANGDGTPVTEEQLAAAVGQALKKGIESGGDPKELNQAAMSWLAVQGEAGNNLLSKLQYASSGKGLSSLGGNEAIGTTAQQGLNDAYENHDTAIHDATNLTSRQNNTADNQTSRSNNADTNRTSITTTGMNNRTSLAGDTMRNATQRDKDNNDRAASTNTQTVTTLDPGTPASGGFFGLGAHAAIPSRKVETKVQASSAQQRSASAAAASGLSAPTAAQAPNGTPDLHTFLAAARRANPGTSDADLKAYYAKTYGAR
jgi:hypothetical protein